MRKHKLPDELAALTPDQLNEVNLWLRKFTYRKVQELLAERFGARTNINKLCRYYQRLQEVEALNDPSTAPVSVKDLIAIKNGEPISDEEIAEDLKLHALRLAQDPNLDATGLKQLFDLFTYSDRRHAREHRLRNETRENELRARWLKSRKQRQHAANNP